MSLWKKLLETILRGRVGETTPHPAATGTTLPEKLYLNLGLDLGTSCSKVVIQSPYVGGRRALAVPNSAAASTESRYLFPSSLRVGSDQRVSLAPDTVGRELTGFKVGLMKWPEDPRATSAAASYLGLLIRRARSWFQESERNLCAGKHVVWLLNVGIPSAGYDDDAIRKSFHNVTKAAWILSTWDQNWTLDDAHVCVAAASAETLSPGVETCVTPEVAAEVVGYARSRRRQEGLHVLVDIGATTLDICGFQLYGRDYQDQYALFTALVQPLGVHQLHAQRLAKLKRARIAISTSVTTLTVADPLTRIPESILDYSSDGRRGGTRLIDIDSNLQNQRTASLMAVLMDLKMRRDPHSPQWNDGLPVFLCGGGSRMRFLRKSIENAEPRLVDATNAQGLLFWDLQKPDNLANDDINDDSFQRLAVAYGLSFGCYDIGEIEPPSRIPDIDPPRLRDWRDPDAEF